MSDSKVYPAIPFIDLETQTQRIKSDIEKAIDKVVQHSGFINGPEVFEFENQLSNFSQVDHVISCANGTDALELVLRAWQLSADDIVVVPAFTFAATAEAVCAIGATPVFVDVDPETFNMSPEKLEEALQVLKKSNQEPKAIISVDIFGQPADYNRIENIAEKHNIKLLVDAAQSMGATYSGKSVGSFGDVTATSFFPAKPLGCFGDGGAILTNDQALANRIRSIKSHGQGKHKYDHVRFGKNSRLDTIQAAILIEKLKIFSDEIERRNAVACYYNKVLSGHVQTSKISPDVISSWAQYSFLTDNRDNVARVCQHHGIPTQVYYPKPLDQQQAYEKYARTDIPTWCSEEISKKILSIPMHPYLKKETQDYIVSVIQEAL